MCKILLKKSTTWFISTQKELEKTTGKQINTRCKQQKKSNSNKAINI
jgi:hypothetical protein